MNKYVKKLLSISSDAFSKEEHRFDEQVLNLSGDLSTQLSSILSVKNGFFSFESALRFFPTTHTQFSCSLNEWNSEDGWRKYYYDLAKDCLFFAEDIFGGQFCIKKDLIYSFDPETGEIERMANDLNEWAQIILDDYDYWTGYSLGNQWQSTHRTLQYDERLIPKTPFVLGGEYEVNNLTAVKCQKGMKFRADLAVRILDAPDGTEITFQCFE